MQESKLPSPSSGWQQQATAIPGYDKPYQVRECRLILEYIIITYICFLLLELMRSLLAQQWSAARKTTTRQIITGSKMQEVRKAESMDRRRVDEVLSVNVSVWVGAPIHSS